MWFSFCHPKLMKLQHMLANELTEEQHNFLFFKTTGSLYSNGTIRLLTALQKSAKCQVGYTLLWRPPFLKARHRIKCITYKSSW